MCKHCYLAMGLLFLVVITAFSIRFYRAHQQAEARKTIVQYLTQGKTSVEGYRVVQYYFDYQIDAESGKLDPQAELIYPHWLVDLLGIDFFANVVSVEILTQPAKDRVDDIILKMFGRLKQLRYLSVGPHTTDEGLKLCRKLTHLEMVGLSFAHITDKGLSYLSRARNLDFLGVSYTKITGSGFRSFPEKNKLKELRLGSTLVDDAGIRVIVQFRSLTSLDLSDTAITNEGLSYLGSLTNLEFLNLRGTNTSRAAIARLAVRIPKCYILSDKGDYFGGKCLDNECCPK